LFSRKQLVEDFDKLGIRAGDIIMVHASVRSVGEVAGGPDQIHLALKDALGTSGTLMMYASCPRYYDEVSRGSLTPEQEREILEKLPSFDPVTARSARDNGALVEFLRTYPRTLVNNHVARFAVWGKHAGYLVSNQPWNYAYGLNSPLDRFLKLDGKILLLGCDHDTVTFLHYAEHVADLPGKRVVHYKVPVEKNGQRVWEDVEEFNTAGDGVHPNWPDRFFAKIVDCFLIQSNNQGGYVGGAGTYLLRAQELLDSALAFMRAVAADARAAEHLHELA